MTFITTLAVVVLVLASVKGVCDEKYDYGSVIDAGSSKCRLHVFRWLSRETSNKTAPRSKPEKINSSEKYDPLTTVDSQASANSLMNNLTVFAINALVGCESRFSTFPIYLKATAGMRLISAEERENILQYVVNYFNSDSNPFAFEDDQAIIAAGEEESIFDWLSVNFAADKLNGDGSATYGALDLGGGSTQIAFAAQPSNDILAYFTSVRLWDETYRVYTHSFLTFGKNEIEESIAQLSYDSAVESGASNVTNPCLNTGYNKSYTVELSAGSTGDVVQVGDSIGNQELCKQYMIRLLLNDTACFEQSCSINGVYQPEIPSDMIFVGFSGFGDLIEECGLDTNSSITEVYELVYKICNMTASEVLMSQCNDYGKDDNEDILLYCRMGTYITVLLHDGYGFPLDTHNIWFTNSLGSADKLDWTQGSMLRDSNWLPYTLDFKCGDCLTSTTAYDAYEVSTFVLLSVLVLIVVCFLIFFGVKYCKKGQHGFYGDSTT